MRKKVLIVDDEPEVVDFLERFLQRHGIDVVKATSGAAAIESYNMHHPDCTFLDVTMPDKDGLSVLKEIKRINPLSRVMMITGKEEKEYQERAKKYGAFDYITKPLDLEELDRKVKQYIL